MLLIRSPADAEFNTCVDIVCAGVDWHAMPRLLGEIDILPPTDAEVGQLEEMLGKKILPPARTRVLQSPARRFHLVAASLKVLEHMAASLKIHLSNNSGVAKSRRGGPVEQIECTHQASRKDLETAWAHLCADLVGFWRSGFTYDLRAGAAATPTLDQKFDTIVAFDKHFGFDRRNQLVRWWPYDDVVSGQDRAFIDARLELVLVDFRYSRHRSEPRRRTSNHDSGNRLSA